MVDRAFSTKFFPIVVAHRGASSTLPENTLEAFEAAFAVGAQVVELDVRLTADGVPVGFQIVGHAFDEAGILAAGHAYQQATDWHLKRPPL
jgi:Asp-tRNA(Asn)/Glu-tRNA(Gln) amidotransferase A subunit family amidase